ncbi:insecticidal delta-endotoxin Cry8Ea1 family protein [Bacillus thuringiensis]|uniref:insecticidal delta-endotoxin Cry8Ea1 family protein n=1 Tax=Bacillus thuringiensis TaxID=1428 RepID=UPI002AB38143|nr:insecticidal delta-endotoxin Cry8Ea1 family protein [Bacillus thuringiensis]MDY8166616.1 insecticidal delta-endotoxin Cry8Ea1 family protein [Bacillus thuringiensis]
MNHNNNNNKYEIIDSHASPYPSNKNSNHSRYPYKNNTNYKDWLNICQQNQQYDEGFETFESADTIAAVSAGIIVAGTMLSAFTAPLGPALIISFGTLLPIFWKPGEDPKTVWKAFVKIGYRPFGLPVDEAIVNLLYNKVDALKTQFEDYQRYFDIWKANPTSQNADAVKNKFLTLDTLVIGTLQELKKDYAIILLPGYTQIANWHLNLLRQAADNYDKWAPSSNLSIQSIYPQDYISDLNTCLTNCSTESNNKVSSKYYKCILKCRIAEYINYCSEKYQDGLNQLKNSSNINWDIYNAYRREMTFTVLDHIAIFPNYDPEKYPTGTHSELTREIYTDAVMRRYETGSPIPIAQREQELTRSPHLFSRLNKFTLFTAKNILPGLHAVQNHFSYTNDSTVRFSPIYKPENLSEPNTDNPPPFDISNTAVRSIAVKRRYEYYHITAIDFDTIDGNPRRYNSGYTPENLDIDYFIFPEFPAGKIPPYGLGTKYTHILSYIKISPRGNLSLPAERELSFAWTHTSVNFNNTISNTITTQIPAVKAKSLDPSSSVISGPGHTGGDLVSLRSSMQIMCYVPTAARYQIRMRCVAYSPNRSINLTLNIAGVTNYSLRVLGIGSIKNIINPKYDDFQYIYFQTEDPQQVATVNLSSNFTMFLNSNDFADNTILIDKFEFIPITNTLEENLETQKLEKIQQTVNTLFTN